MRKEETRALERLLQRMEWAVREVGWAAATLQVDKEADSLHKARATNAWRFACDAYRFACNMLYRNNGESIAQRFIDGTYNPEKAKEY